MIGKKLKKVLKMMILEDKGRKRRKLKEITVKC